MKAAQKGSTENAVPSWAVLTETETRNLYKPEPAPARESQRRGEEKILLRLFRKLGREERLRITLLASEFALDRIRARLSKGKGGQRA